MAKKFKVLRDRMTPEQRAESAALTDALLAEMSLDELRRDLNVSQDDLAGILGIQQAAVSKQFRRPDWHVSTLQRYIAAFGGELELVARFPDRTVRLTSVGEQDAPGAA
jgi:hypothetical protein